MSKSIASGQTHTLPRERYAGVGVNADRARKSLATIPISLPCSQGDDMAGFEKFGRFPAHRPTGSPVSPRSLRLALCALRLAPRPTGRG